MLHSLLKRFPWIPFFLLFSVLATLGSLAHPLWGDEAETALFGRNVLAYGIPKGWDGVNIMGIQDATVLNRDLINYKSPWAQYYLEAASFALFPQNSFTARLPFLFLGMLVIPTLYLLAKSLTQSKQVALLASGIASLSVPFILFSYQARYYSLVILMAVVLTYASLRLTERKIWPKLLFIITSVLFFYGNYVAFFSFSVALFFGFQLTFFISYLHRKEEIFLKEARKFLISYIFCMIPVLLLTLPWILYFKPFSSSIQQGLINTSDDLASFVYFFLDSLFKYNDNGVFPFVFVPLWLVIILKKLRQKEPFAPLFLIGVIPFLFLSVMAFFTGIAHVETTFTATRYTMIAFPFFTTTAAYLLYELVRWKKYIGWAVIVLFVGTTLFSLKPPPRMFLAEYLSEVASPYQTPDKVVAEYLEQHAKEGDTAFVSIDRDHEPLEFHLGKKIRFVRRISITNPVLFPHNRDLLPAYLYKVIVPPEWIILYGKHGNDGSFLTFDFREMPLSINLQRDYTETVLPVFFSDLSRPEIELRSFVGVPAGPEDMVYVYRYKGQETSK